MLKIFGDMIEVAEKNINGYYRKKQFFVDMIRVFDMIDIKEMDQFSYMSAAFEEALDLAKFSGVR